MYTRLMDALPKELAQDADDKWNAFQVAAQNVHLNPPDRRKFLVELKRVFAFSDFVANACIRKPAYLAQLIETGDLQRKYRPNEYAHKLKPVLAALSEKDENLLAVTLRGFRLREMLRIAWRDLANLAELTETMEDLTALAEALIHQSLSLLYDRQCLKYGVPLGPDNSNQRLVVVGMGKLGGRELNFSSDVDLIFAYPSAGKTNGGATSLSNEEFFTRLCRSLIHVIGTPTADGIVFRVDMRLRPYGESGPLVMSFDATESYYQSQGREWERYAWIKARIVAGDKTAGAELLKRLKPFVYRRYLDYGTFEALRQMKQMISLEIMRKGMKEDIKLGPGGIREIEFFGQIFQLIRGGIVPVLQERGIQKVLKALASEDYISYQTCHELLNAYAFLRNTEHRLQEFCDQQTHKLPLDTTNKLRLAVAMGFSDWSSYFALLKQHMTAVHAHFDKLLGHGDSEDPQNKDQELLAELRGIWQNGNNHEGAQNILIEAGFSRPAEALGLLENLRNASTTRALSNEGRIRLDKLIPLVLRQIGQSDQADTVLNRIIDLIKAIQRRTNYLSLLLENPPALIHLVKLAHASPWIASFLSQHPVLLDELLDPRTLYSPPKRSDLEREIQRKIALIPPTDLEYQIIELCIFKQINILRVAAADVTGALALMRVSDYLTELAETVLNKVLELAWNSLVEKHGSPLCHLDGDPCDRAFSMIGYGKLGGIELGYGADLDLVFIHAGAHGQTQGSSQPIDTVHFFSRLGQRIIHILSASTPAGILYETDMRLRPDGSSGILVVNIDSFRDYQEKKAWTWEHQALIRARPICGDEGLKAHFNKIRRDILVRPRDRNKLQKEVTTMRERMRQELLTPQPGIFDIKQDAGGIVDIEFLIQYLVLLNAHEHADLTKWTDMVRLLETLVEIGIIDQNIHRILKEAYLSYRSTVHMLSLQEKPAKIAESEFHQLRNEVRKIWNTLIGKPSTQ